MQVGRQFRAIVAAALAIGLWHPAVTTVAYADDVPARAGEDQERQLFRTLLRSLSIQRRPAGAPAEPKPDAAITPAPASRASSIVQPGASIGTRALRVSPQGPPGNAANGFSRPSEAATATAPPSCCPACAAPLRAGQCPAQVAGACEGGESSGGPSSGMSDGTGTGADSGAPSRQDTGKRPGGTASGPAGAAQSQRPQVSAMTGAAQVGGDAPAGSSSGARRVSRSAGVDPRPAIAAEFADQASAVSVIAARAASAMAARGGGPGGNQPQDLLGIMAAAPAMLDSIHAAAAVGPGLRWTVVKPAGMDPAAAESAVSLETGQTEDRGDQRKTFRLDAGAMRSELLTGPENPLLVPPGVASIVYVIDCSSSMAGTRFKKVAAAVSEAVNQLSENQKFSVILFNSVALQIDDGGLLAATDDKKRLLESQLSQVVPVGGTDPTDALLIALQMKPQSVVVFSDGEFDAHVVQRVTRLNRSSGSNCRIDCVGVGVHVTTLRTLASLNGPGIYIETP